MIQKLRLVLFVLVAVMIGATVWVLLRPKVEQKRQAVETREAVRKTAEFLTPDTKSDIRFGKKADGPTPPATPAPAGP